MVLYISKPTWKYIYTYLYFSIIGSKFYDISEFMKIAYLPDTVHSLNDNYNQSPSIGFYE